MKKQKNTHKKDKKTRSLLILIGVLVSLILILVLGGNLYIDSLLNRTIRSRKLSNEDALVSQEVLDQVKNHRIVNIALFGSDNARKAQWNDYEMERSDATKIVSLDFDSKKINPLIAFVIGFTFSFAWTPCIGPALSSILLLANSSQNLWMSNFLMVIYALGLTIPFLLIGIFTDSILNWLSNHKSIMNYTVKLGAIILIFFGVSMVSGKMNFISNYMTQSSNNAMIKDKNEDKKEDGGENKDEKNSEQEKALLQQLGSYELKDQHDKIIKLEDYKGKVVFLNFWATWCPPCRGELPNIQKLYEKYRSDKHVAILTIVYPGGQEKGKSDLKEFISDNALTVPVLFDDGFIYSTFGIGSMPTTFMLDKEGKPYGYIEGALTMEMMENMILKTLNAN